MKQNNLGCFLVSYYLITPGKEVVLIGSKDDVSGEMIVLNSFTGTEAVNMIGKLLGKSDNSPWRDISDSSTLPDKNVPVLVRRLSTVTNTYIDPIVDTLDSDGNWINTIGNSDLRPPIRYDAWQELPPNTDKDVLK